MRRFGIMGAVVLAAAAGLLFAPGARAQEASEEDRERARAAYARGQELFRAGSFEEAEAAFEEAFEAVPNPVVLVSIGEARQRQGDAAGAVEAFEQYLEEREDAPDREEIAQRLENLRSMPATVAVSSTPVGASIAVDGEDTGQVTPADLELEPGTHEITVSMEGYEDGTETVEATFGSEHELNLMLDSTGGGGGIQDPFGDETGGTEPGPEPDPVDTGDDEGPSAGVWVSAGISGAALVGGTVLGFLALSEQSDFDEMPTEDAADRGERLALFADVAFGVAAAAGITAIVLYMTGGDDGSEESASAVRVTPVLTEGGGGVAAGATF